MAVHALDKARRTGLNDCNVPFVEGQNTYHVQCRGKYPSTDTSQSHTKVLSQAWINSNAAAVPLGICVLGDHLHVHEG